MMNNEVLKFRKNQRIKKISQILLQIGLLAFILILWEVLVNIKVLNEFLVSKPSAIFELFIKYFGEGTIWNDIGISLLETTLGLIIGTALGLIIAIILWLSKSLAKILEPFLVVLNALPKTALAPIIIIWAGTGVKGIVVVAISISLVLTILSAYSYFVNVDENQIKMLQTFNANKFQILWKLILPANFVNIINIIKINIGMSWVGVMVGEFLVSRAGIGYLTMYGSQVFQLDLVMMCVILLAFIAFIMYEIVNLIEIYYRKRR